MSRNEFGAGIARLVVRYSQAFPGPQLDAWYADLKKMPAGQFAYLIGIFLREVQTWPWKLNLPAKLREFQRACPYSPPRTEAKEEHWRHMTSEEQAEWKRVRDETASKMRAEKED